VGTALDDAGVAWVVRQVVERHELAFFRKSGVPDAHGHTID
jgi:hypothetical protein